MSRSLPSLGSSTTSARRRSRVVLVGAFALLLVSCASVAGVAVATEPITDLDENTALTDRSTWETYQSKGVTSVSVGAPDLDITIAEEHEDAGVNGWKLDTSRSWLRVEYNEEIERTIRFYIPSNYWGPYYDEAVEPEQGDDVSAKLVPVDGGRYQAVTITFTGPTTAVYPVSNAKGKTWAFWSKQDERLSNKTGVSTGVSGTDQWNYAESTDWSNGTIAVDDVADPDRFVVEYDADVSNESDPVWLRAPEGETRGEPVYYFVREPANASENATVVIVSKADDPPAVRIKRQTTARDGVGAVWRDWGNMADRARETLGRLFGNS